MSKTLWHTIQIEVPKEMVNITKKDKVVVKKSLTINKAKKYNISKANNEPSIKKYLVIQINQKILMMVKNGILKN